MIALIDADIVTFRCAASCKEGDGPEISNLRADILMRQIIEETQAESYRAFLSGSRNFRYDIYPEYKANRRDIPRPVHLQSCREFLVTEWNATVTDGYEADDALGIAQTQEMQVGFEDGDEERPFIYGTIISSIDKDLLAIPGRHHNIVSKEIIEVSPLKALRTFYKQLLLGDRSDNVPGFDGVARQKPTNFLKGCYEKIDSLDNEVAMFEFVREIYDEHGEAEHLTRNARLLHILRKEDDKWQEPSSIKSL
ncbi:MAG: hypothetical protein NUV80_07390 [Candidatus Berkelbacteria bacterium]|nr:hypothetical protein [Candidatus Berkelbacteria bacterium]